MGISQAVQWLNLYAYTAGVECLILGKGTKIPACYDPASWVTKKKKAFILLYLLAPGKNHWLPLKKYAQSFHLLTSSCTSQSVPVSHSCSQAEICELSGSLYTLNASKSFKIKLIQQRGRNSIEWYVGIFITSKWTIHFKWLIPLHCNLCLVLANETN